MAGMAGLGRVRLSGGGGEALGGRPGGFVIGVFLKGQGLILPRRAWYKGRGAENKLEINFLQGVCTMCGLVHS